MVGDIPSMRSPILSVSRNPILIPTNEKRLALTRGSTDLASSLNSVHRNHKLNTPRLVPKSLFRGQSQRQAAGMAAQSSLVQIAPAAAFTPAAAATVKRVNNVTLMMQRDVCHVGAQRADDHRSSRRALVLRSLAAVGIGSLMAAPEDAAAAKRRPPPPPAAAPEEKKDPNVSGVLAKVLASKKRKEAMKEAVAKMREKGNAVVVN